MLMTALEAKILSMGAWVAKNILRTSRFRRKGITEDQLYEWRHWGSRAHSAGNQ